MNFLRSLNWLGIAVVIGTIYLIGAGVACVVKQPEPPPVPAPQLIEWEVDKDYGDKRTTLPNGLHLYVYKVEDSTSTSTTWGWTVGSEGMTEREAIERALHMGGVK